MNNFNFDKGNKNNEIELFTIMRIRSYFLPRSLQDWGATLFFFLAIPITYWFELWIVIPEIHSNGSFFTIIYFILGTLVLLNIVASILAVMLCDTSIKGEVLVSTNDQNSDLKTWHFCAVCETIVPPRSWHCSMCRTCILKRDHHCIFTGCCIGHKNHRYFITLLLFLFIATTYASVYNNYFIWVIHGEQFNTLTSYIKLIFPLAMLLVDVTTQQYYLAIYLVNMVGAVFSFALLIYHGRIILNGSVVHEKDSKQYNLGKRENLEMVFGERWKIAWLTPFIKSELPHNGINWETVSKLTQKGR